MYVIDVEEFRRKSSKYSVKDLDEKYLKISIKHEEAALEMAKEAVRRGKDSAVRKIARELISSETGEIAELKELLNNQ